MLCSRSDELGMWEMESHVTVVEHGQSHSVPTVYKIPRVSYLISWRESSRELAYNVMQKVWDENYQ